MLALSQDGPRPVGGMCGYPYAVWTTGGAC